MKILDSRKESVAVCPQAPVPDPSLGQEGGEGPTGVCQGNSHYINSSCRCRGYLPDIADDSPKFQQYLEKI